MDTTQHKLYDRLQPDQVIGPGHHRFRLLKALDDWPLGKRWQAEDISATGRPEVTLLMLDPLLLAENSVINALKQHVTLSRRLQHRHIAQVYGLLVDHGLVFLSLEALDGLSLAQLLAGEPRGQLKPPQIKTLLVQLAAALEAAQRKQVLHGALAPELVFINRRGGVKLSLFGLRSALDQVNDQLSPPLDYPRYQAPEAFHPGNLSPQADVYSLACIAYELFSGQPANLPGQADSRSRKLLTRPETLSENQWEALQQGLASQPEQRQPSPLALVQALFKAEPPPAPQDTAPVQAAEARLAGKHPRLSLKLPRWARPAGAIALSLCGGYLLAYVIHSPHQQQLAGAEADARQSRQQLAAMTLQLAQQADALDRLQQSLTAAQQALSNARAASTEQGNPERPGTKVFADRISGSHYGPEMVLLPAGLFEMGDLNRQGDDNEQPVHQVRISRPFALARHEVTFAQYDLFARDTGRALPADEGWGRGTRPVINVSWHDAQAYAAWLAQQTGLPYRLPSEAEWEYAARAGSRTAYWWGDKLQPGLAVCDDCGSEWDGRSSAPVGSFKGNPWGLFDMSGNVYEWVADCYSENYRTTPVDGRAHGGDCAARVLRGGSWFEIARLVRPASRYRFTADSKRSSWGFRVALDINE